MDTRKSGTAGDTKKFLKSSTNRNMPEVTSPAVKRNKTVTRNVTKKALAGGKVKMVVVSGVPAIKSFEITDKFCILLMPEGGDAVKKAKNTVDINIDDWFNYPSLRQYHGPSSIIDILRFKKLVDDTNRQKIRLIASADCAKRTNAAFLVGAYLVLWGGLDAEHVCSLVRKASEGMPAYQTEGADPYPDTITVFDCIRALRTFRDLGLIDFSRLDEEKIAFYEDPENGDMNWIVPGQFLAFAGPDHANLEDFITFAKEHNIRAVVRLNEHEYEPVRLESAGISHLDIPMVDGSVPTLPQIKEFHSYVHPIIRSGGAIAVHCRAGLGRTGTMTGTYLVREHKLQVAQMIAMARIMRPGCFLTKQPRFMEAIQWWLRDEEPTEEQEAFIEWTVGAQLAQQMKMPFADI